MFHKFLYYWRRGAKIAKPSYFNGFSCQFLINVSINGRGGENSETFISSYFLTFRQSSLYLLISRFWLVFNRLSSYLPKFVTLPSMYQYFFVFRIIYSYLIICHCIYEYFVVSPCTYKYFIVFLIIFFISPSRYTSQNIYDDILQFYHYRSEATFILEQSDFLSRRHCNLTLKIYFLKFISY